MILKFKKNTLGTLKFYSAYTNNANVFNLNVIYIFFSNFSKRILKHLVKSRADLFFVETIFKLVNFQIHNSKSNFV